MNCAELEILICDYVDGTLSAAQKAEVEPPPELITRILFDAPWGKAKSRSKAKEWGLALLSPILQPKFAMGMAMTILSISMLARFVMPVRQLHPADLRPAEVWAGIEDRAVRTWARTVKFYENLKFVYQIQTTLKEWQQQTDEQKPIAAKPDDRKLPVKSTAPAAAPAESH